MLLLFDKEVNVGGSDFRSRPISLKAEQIAAKNRFESDVNMCSVFRE